MSPRLRDLWVGEEKVDLEKLYTLGTKVYIAQGNDGFSVFNEPTVSKQPMETDEDIEKLPILKDEISKRLEKIDSNGENLNAGVEGRIQKIESINNFKIFLS